MSEPGPDPGTSTAGLFSAYLEYFREQVVEAVVALPDEERRNTRLVSGWTPVELLSHLLHMEQRWFIWGFLGEDVDEPWGDWTADPGEDDDARWAVPADVTAEQLARRLRQVGARTREILTTRHLDVRGIAGPRFEGEPPDLRWICFHVLHEYARHVGHLDIAVELAPATSE